MTEEPSKVFLIDTNVFIDSHRRHYAMDLCPGFWDCLEHYCQEGRLMSIDRVRDEISEGDPLDDWIKQAPSELFVSTAEADVAETFGEMMAWVNDNGQFQPSAKAAFASVADGWLVAYAKVHELVVVTEEAFRPDSKRSVKIPNVCEEFGVSYMNTFEMLHSLKVRFTWK